MYGISTAYTILYTVYTIYSVLITQELQTEKTNTWYYGYLSRNVAEDIIQNFIRERYINKGLDQCAGAGSFLLRRSGTPANPSNLVISIWTNNKIQHSKIKVENHGQGNIRYTLNRDNYFDKIEDLVQYHEASLRYPIPNPVYWKRKLWYKGTYFVILPKLFRNKHLLLASIYNPTKPRNLSLIVAC